MVDALAPKGWCRVRPTLAHSRKSSRYSVGIWDVGPRGKRWEHSGGQTETKVARVEERNWSMEGIPMDNAELTVGDLFDRLPVQFGLRGDPYLWQVLRTEFAETPMPSAWFELRGIVYEAVERVIGQPLKEDGVSASIYVSQFDPGPGMSAGHVDTAWWVNTGVPILLDRFEAMRPAD